MPLAYCVFPLLILLGPRASAAQDAALYASTERDLANAFGGANARHVVMVKVSYWMNR